MSVNRVASRFGGFFSEYKTSTACFTSTTWTVSITHLYSTAQGLRLHRKMRLSVRILTLMLVMCTLCTATKSHRRYFLRPFPKKCGLDLFRFPTHPDFIAVVRCKCFGGITKVDSIIRSTSPQITRGLLKCANKNLDEIGKLCVIVGQSNFPSAVLSIAEECCSEAGGALTGDRCDPTH